MTDGSVFISSVQVTTGVTHTVTPVSRAEDDACPAEDDGCPVEDDEALCAGGGELTRTAATIPATARITTAAAAARTRREARRSRRTCWPPGPVRGVPGGPAVRTFCVPAGTTVGSEAASGGRGPVAAAVGGSAGVGDAAGPGQAADGRIDAGSQSARFAAAG